MNTHTPVFYKEAIDELAVKKGEMYIDATYGEGGHALEILRRGGKLLCIDLDLKQFVNKRLELITINDNFANIELVAKQNNFYPVSGVLFDFGLSMGQIRNSGKGFSYEAKDDLLDMRIGDMGTSAAELLNTQDFETLEHDLMKYSEDVVSPLVAKKIVEFRSKTDIKYVKDLIAIIDSVEQIEIKNRKKCYSRIFQALRIMVNNEMENILKALIGALAITKTGGKIVTISFHSLEDRIVKNFIKRNKAFVSDELKNIGKQRDLKSFERSAKLRVITKL